GIAQKLESRAMNRVRAALGSDIDLVHVTAELGRWDPGFDFEFLQCVERRQKYIEIEIGVAVLKPVQHIVVVENAVAPDGDVELASRAALALVGHRGERATGVRTGNERSQLQIIAPVQR